MSSMIRNLQRSMTSVPDTEGKADACMGSRLVGVGTLTQNDIDVIRERRFGWEEASPKLLAAVFGVSVQRINAVCNHPHIFKPIQ